MNKFELQSKLWFWWPVVAFVALFALVDGGVWYFWPEAEQFEVEVEVEDYGRMEDLTYFTGFRSAYLKANGGEERLEALQSIRASGVMESGGSEAEFFTIKRRPDKSLTTLKMAEYDLTFGVDGAVVWQRITVEGQEPQYELKSGAEAQALGEMGIFFDPIMSVLLFDQGTIERLSASQWMGTDTVKLEFVSEANIRAVAYVDIRTMQPLARIEKFVDGGERKVLYGDYRKVGGMLEPFEVETYLDDVLQSRVILKKSEVNVGTVPALFRYPERLREASAAVQLELEH